MSDLDTQDATDTAPPAGAKAMRASERPLRKAGFGREWGACRRLWCWWLWLEGIAGRFAFGVAARRRALAVSCGAGLAPFNP